MPRVKNEIGPYMQRRLRETFGDHPLVGDVRGLGLLAAIELVPNKPEARIFPAQRAMSGHIAVTIVSKTASSCARSATQWC